MEQAAAVEIDFADGIDVNARAFAFSNQRRAGLLHQCRILLGRLQLEAQIGETDLMQRLDGRRHDRVERRRGIDRVIARHAGKRDPMRRQPEVVEGAATHDGIDFGTAHDDDDVVGRIRRAEQRYRGAGRSGCDRHLVRRKIGRQRRLRAHGRRETENDCEREERGPRRSRSAAGLGAHDAAFYSRNSRATKCFAPAFSHLSRRLARRL